MISVILPTENVRENGSNQVTFRVVDEKDIELLRKDYDHHEMNIKAGDLLVILEPKGYEEIAEFYVRRHNPHEKNKWGTNQELAELFEHLVGNSDWDWIPQDEDNDLSNGDHMFVDDYGDVRVLTGFWTDANAWRDDPLEQLFLHGYLIYDFHKQLEFSDEEFFHVPEAAKAAWQAGEYDTFRELVDAAGPAPRSPYA
jgi:hypothetical protein